MDLDETTVTAVDTVDQADTALADNERFVTTQGRLLPIVDGIDVIICATGVPQIGADMAHRSITDGKHVVMLTDETDAVGRAVLE